MPERSASIQKFLIKNCVFRGFISCSSGKADIIVFPESMLSLYLD